MKSVAELSRQEQQELARNILWRDGHQCRRCGAKENISVHHLIARRGGGSDGDKNLITLCQMCHDWVELNRPTWNEIIEKQPKVDPPNDCYAWLSTDGFVCVTSDYDIFVRAQGLSVVKFFALKE